MRSESGKPAAVDSMAAVEYPERMSAQRSIDPAIPPHTAAALYQTGIARAALVATNENWNWSVTKAAVRSA